MILNMEASLIRFCGDVILEAGLNNFKPFNFDTHATINEIPDGNFIGVAELSLTDDDENYEVGCQFVIVTTTRDTDLKLLRNAVDKVHKWIKKSKNAKIVILNSETGAQLGFLTPMSPLRVLPVGATKGRPIQTIAVQFGSSILVGP